MSKLLFFMHAPLNGNYYVSIMAIVCFLRNVLHRPNRQTVVVVAVVVTSLQFFCWLVDIIKWISSIFMTVPLVPALAPAPAPGVPVSIGVESCDGHCRTEDMIFGWRQWRHWVDFSNRYGRSGGRTSGWHIWMAWLEEIFWLSGLGENVIMHNLIANWCMFRYCMPAVRFVCFTSCFASWVRFKLLTTGHAWWLPDKSLRSYKLNWDWIH